MLMRSQPRFFPPVPQLAFHLRNNNNRFAGKCKRKWSAGDPRPLPRTNYFKIASFLRYLKLAGVAVPSRFSIPSQNAQRIKKKVHLYCSVHVSFSTNLAFTWFKQQSVSILELCSFMPRPTLLDSVRLVRICAAHAHNDEPRVTDERNLLHRQHASARHSFKRKHGIFHCYLHNYCTTAF